MLMNHVLLALSPGFLFATVGEKSGTVWSLNPESGRRTWIAKTGGSAAVKLSPDGTRLVVVSKHRKGMRLEAIDTAKGKAAWGRGVEGVGHDLIVSAERIVAAGTVVKAFDPASGEPLWDAPLAELGEEGRSLLTTPHGIVAWNAAGVALLGASDGKTRWVQRTEKGGIKRIVADGDVLYRLTGVEKGSDTLERLNTADGKPAWKVDTGGLVVSPLIMRGGILAYTLDDALVGLKSVTGTPAFRQKFDAPFAAAGPSAAKLGGVPDVVTVSGDLLVIDRDAAGMRSYRLPSGKPAWTMPQFPARATVEGFYRDLLVGMKVNLAPGAEPVPKIVDWQTPRPNAMAVRAQQNYEQTMRRTARVLADSNASAGDRKAAISTRRMATSLELSRMETGMAMDRMVTTAQSALAAAEAIVSIGHAIKQAREQAIMSNLLTRARMNLSSAIGSRGAAFREKVHVSGFWTGNGSGVRIVHLGDGRIQELMYEPSDGLHRVAMVRTDAFALSPSGTRMVLVGLGNDDSKYRVVKSAGVRGATASILCFDPTQAKDAPKPPPLPAPVGKGADEMKAAVLAGDLAKVKALLDAGDDPNQTLMLVPGNPPILTTPLRLAAAGHVEIVKLLLKRGAKPTLESVPGPTAMDFASKSQDPAYPQFADTRDEVRKILQEAGAKYRHFAPKK
jgi:outer membrane protein assembly factor BamB